MTLSTVAVDSLTSAQRLNDLPVNGRNWMSFMALAPGAVDGANGSNTAVRFFATTGDDENYRVDGMDATSAYARPEHAAQQPPADVRRRGP